MALTKREKIVLANVIAKLEMKPGKQAFGTSIGESVLVCPWQGNLPEGDPIDATEYIADRTKLWRETWILPYLKAILDGDQIALDWMADGPI